jgi:hypothetical protein
MTVQESISSQGNKHIRGHKVMWRRISWGVRKNMRELYASQELGSIGFQGNEAQQRARF